jgi:hypothetical protein
VSGIGNLDLAVERKRWGRRESESDERDREREETGFGDKWK